MMALNMRLVQTKSKQAPEAVGGSPIHETHVGWIARYIETGSSLVRTVEEDVGTLGMFHHHWNGVVVGEV
jgi:hypothetical protein